MKADPPPLFKKADPAPLSKKVHSFFSRAFWQNLTTNEPFDGQLTPRQQKAVLLEVSQINFRRIRAFSFLFLVVELIWLAVHDLPQWFDPQIAHHVRIGPYIIGHLTIAAIAVILIWRSAHWIAEERVVHRRSDDLITDVVVIAVLLLLNIIDFFEGFSPTMVTFFFLKMILASVFFILRSPDNFVVFTIPFVAYIANIVMYSHESDSRIHSLINGIILYGASVVISRQVYETQVRMLSRNILLAAANDQLQHLSHHDPLTGLANRTRVEAQTTKFIEENRVNGRSISLIMVDLDHFKQVNDTYGHPFGDIAMRAVADTLTETIPGPSLAIRWGGEEFVILLGLRHNDRVADIAEMMRLRIEALTFTARPVKSDLNQIPQDVHITASFGVANLTGNLDQAFQLALVRADRAMYQAKQEGRNRVVIG